MQTKLLGIINMDFGVIDTVLTRYSAFASYWRKEWSTVGSKLLFFPWRRLCGIGTNGHFVHPLDIRVNMKQLWDDIGRRKPKASEKDLSQCHFVHHKQG
jgi:hypothetical protein